MLNMVFVLGVVSVNMCIAGLKSINRLHDPLNLEINKIGMLLKKTNKSKSKVKCMHAMLDNFILCCVI